MNLLVLLNKDIPLGKSLNALAHMAIGLGYRVNGNPGINIYFGNNHQLQEFRSLINKLPEPKLVSDFTDTMTEETAVEQIKRTKLTKEKELKYFSVSGVIPSGLLENLEPVLKNCIQLEGYSPEVSQGEVTLNPKKEFSIPEVPPKYKLVSILSKKVNITDIINPLTKSCIEIGKKANLEDLCLLDFIDGDGNSHYGISFHNFPILTSKNNSKHISINEDAELKDVIFSKISNTVLQNNTEQEQALVTTIFGKQEMIDEIVPRKFTSLFNANIDFFN